MTYKDQIKAVLDKIGKGKQPPTFFHSGGDKTLLKLSKAAWQDVAWNLAARCAENDRPESIRAVLVDEATITDTYRKIAKMQRGTL